MKKLARTLNSPIKVNIIIPQLKKIKENIDQNDLEYSNNFWKNAEKYKKQCLQPRWNLSPIKKTMIIIREIIGYIPSKLKSHTNTWCGF